MTRFFMREINMRGFILGVVWSTMVCGVMASAVMADAPESEADKAAVAKAMETFAGTWEIVGVQPDGATKGARRLVFNKDGTYAARDKDGKELWGGTFEIDPTTMPPVWDHRSHAGKKEGQDVLGIYDLDGDKLKVACVVGQWKGKEWLGKSRPTGFSPQKADVVIEFKRVKPGK
jgi:uncharacterized protein (TIGR03067 family)